MASTRRNFIRTLGIAAYALNGVTLTEMAHAMAYPRKVLFSDQRGFDEEVSLCMREGFEVIEVELPQQFRREMRPRLRAWLERIKETGGEIRFRARGRAIWLPLIGMIVGLVGPYVIDAILKALRDPARDYHAVVTGRGYSSESTQILTVAFYRRASPSWAEARENSRPMQLA